MSVRGRLVAAFGAGLMLTLGGAAATAAPTTAAAQPELRQLIDIGGFNAPPENCNLYQSPNDTRASICSSASIVGPSDVLDGYYRGTRAGNNGYIEVRIDSTIYRMISWPDFRGTWKDARSVQFRACGNIGGCGPWK